eukprot:6673007-Pyramimonas_sp.AAC.1
MGYPGFLEPYSGIERISGDVVSPGGISCKAGDPGGPGLLAAGSKRVGRALRRVRWGWSWIVRATPP